MGWLLCQNQLFTQNTDAVLVGFGNKRTTTKQGLFHVDVVR